MGSSMFGPDLGHLCRGGRIHTSGHSEFGFLNNLGASSIFLDTASAACAITFITFAAVICDGDEPCSVNAA